MIYTLYLCVAALFFIRSILRLEDNIFCHVSSRSRETKALMKRHFRREKRDLLLSIVWPVLLMKTIHFLVTNRSLLFTDKNGKS